MGNFLDGLIAGLQRIYHGGVAKPKRPNLNFVSGASIADNPGTDSLDVTVNGGSAADGVATVSALAALTSSDYVNKQVRTVTAVQNPYLFAGTLGAGKAGSGIGYTKPTDIGAPGAGAWISQGVPTIPTIADLRAEDGGFHQRMRVLGHTTLTDGGGGEFLWDDTNNNTTNPDDGGIVIVPTTLIGGTGAWIRQYSGIVQRAWFGEAAVTTMANAFAHKRITLTYGTTVAINARLGNAFKLTITDGVAFTISNPTNPTDGQHVSIRVKNASGGDMGVVTFGSAYRLTWTPPADGYSRNISFEYDSADALWWQISTPFDVPNS